MTYQINVTMQHYDDTTVILPACNCTVIIMSTHMLLAQMLWICFTV